MNKSKSRRETLKKGSEPIQKKETNKSLASNEKKLTLLCHARIGRVM